MDLLYYTVISFAWALGGFISGITSMGCALVALPILSLVMDTGRAVLISCVCGCIIPAVLAVIHHKGIIRRELSLMLAASIPGIAIGLIIYQYMPSSWLSTMLGLLLAVVVFWQMLGKRCSFFIHAYTVPAVLAGFFGGIALAVAAVPGAITGIYATLRPWSKENLLSMQSVYFAASYLFTIGLQIGNGLYSREILYDIFCCVPGMALGILLSIPAQKHVSQHMCRSFLLVLLGISSAMLLSRGLFQ